MPSSRSLATTTRELIQKMEGELARAKLSLPTAASEEALALGLPTSSACPCLADNPKSSSCADQRSYHWVTKLPGMLAKSREA